MVAKPLTSRAATRRCFPIARTPFEATLRATPAAGQPARGGPPVVRYLVLARVNTSQALICQLRDLAALVLGQLLKHGYRSRVSNQADHLSQGLTHVHVFAACRLGVELGKLFPPKLHQILLGLVVSPASPERGDQLLQVLLAPHPVQSLR